MDFGQAALLIAAVYAITEFAKKVLPDKLAANSKIVQGVSMAIAIGMVFLVATSVWANEQLIGGKPLDALDGWSKLLVGLLIGGGANLAHTLFGKDGTIRNIGENQPPTS